MEDQTHPSAVFPSLKNIVKRTFDLVVGLMMLVAFAPLMVLIGLLIVLFDGRQVIYSHKRVGRNGESFGCLKFRTMVRDSDARLAEVLQNDAAARKEWNTYRKLRNDPRILPVIGAILRRSSLDELPQILNVIRGDMSMVGPRPVITEELTHYGAASALYCSVRPGLTGPWQIGERSNCSYDERVRQDIDYIQNATVVSDMQIVAKTAMVLLRGSAPGAY